MKKQKIRLDKKIVLKKSIVANLNNNDQNGIAGGSNGCPFEATGVASCSPNCYSPDPAQTNNGGTLCGGSMNMTVDQMGCMTYAVKPFICL
ncbi:class I lanthipeptide [Taibaiella koreensis]|uniref:class I lanthipeptide n=1 Tax=Taibaiella koreensis TaxID=1268548 RepID=UPI000E59FB77|nr:class I lanthipeptide [Taibaiella koreensis]